MKKTTLSRFQKGFTLIEILVVIGIIAILAAIVIIAINPARQFAQARNSQRTSNVQTILNAVGQNMADNKGVFVCADGDIPTVETTMSEADYDIRSCIAPVYLPEIPVDPDPAVGSNTCTDVACGTGESYDTGYTIERDSSTQRITVCAPAGAEPSISGSGPICLTR